MTFEYTVYKSKGHAHEKGRHGTGVSTVKYKAGQRPAWLDGYEIVFQGDPYQHMEWLKENQHKFPCLNGVDIGAKPPKKVAWWSRVHWKWVSIAAGAAATAYAAYHYLA